MIYSIDITDAGSRGGADVPGDTTDSAPSTARAIEVLKRSKARRGVAGVDTGRSRIAENRGTSELDMEKPKVEVAAALEH